MPTSLATWFHDWTAGRDMTFKLPASMKHRRVHTNSAKCYHGDG